MNIDQNKAVKNANNHFYSAKNPRFIEGHLNSPSSFCGRLCGNLFSVKQYLWPRFDRKSLAKSMLAHSQDFSQSDFEANLQFNER